MSSASRTATAAPEPGRPGRDAPATDGARAWLALGANLGDREATLRRALDALSGFVHLDAVSSVYETDPVGFTDQPVFWNLVAGGRTALAPAALMRACLDVEAALGRVRTFRNAPRTVDIDVLLLDDRVVDEPGIVLPHPRLHERAFVLQPLAEIAPDLRHPLTGARIAELADAAGTAGVRRLAEPRFTPAARP